MRLEGFRIRIGFASVVVNAKLGRIRHSMRGPIILPF